MPAEFEAQHAILVKWSGREWMDDSAIALLQELVTHVFVIVLVDSHEAELEVRNVLRVKGVSLERVTFLQIPSNSTWVRDFGPLTVLGSDGFPIWIDYQHPSPETYSDNDLFIERLSRYTGHRVVRGPLLLEGGNVLTNGAGTIVCTRQLENDNLQLGFDTQNFRKKLGQMLGCSQVVVLENLDREPTGHVDWFVTFVSENTVVLGEFSTKVDATNARILDENAARLQQAGFRVVRIPMPPHPPSRFGGSYTNVVFANGKLLVPQWAEGDTDAEAIKIFRDLLPDWQIVPIDCSAMLSNSGALHCATSNIPKMPISIPDMAIDAAGGP